MIGNVAVGSEHPIRTQTMTTTDTKDVKATVDQVRHLRSPERNIFLHSSHQKFGVQTKFEGSCEGHASACQLGLSGVDPQYFGFGKLLYFGLRYYSVPTPVTLEVAMDQKGMHHLGLSSYQV